MPTPEERAAQLVPENSARFMSDSKSGQRTVWVAEEWRKNIASEIRSACEEARAEERERIYQELHEIALGAVDCPDDDTRCDSCLMAEEIADAIKTRWDAARGRAAGDVKEGK